MTRFRNSTDTCRYLGNIHPNTLKNWVSSGFITAYKTSDGSFAYDLDEIEAELARNPRMRDKRNPFGERARVVPLPPTASVPRRVEAVSPDEVRS